MPVTTKFRCRNFSRLFPTRPQSLEHEYLQIYHIAWHILLSAARLAANQFSSLVVIFLPHKLVCTAGLVSSVSHKKKSKGRSHFGFYHSKYAVTSTCKFPASSNSDLRCWLASLKIQHFLQAAKRLPSPTTSGGIFDAAANMTSSSAVGRTFRRCRFAEQRQPLLRHRAAEDFRPHRNCWRHQSTPSASFELTSWEFSFIFRPPSFLPNRSRLRPARRDDEFLGKYPF